MDLSVIAAVGSFVVSERVLKPKATVLVILGLVLIYDLKTKTHDVSSLRVYRGPALVAFTLMMAAFSLRTWRRNGVACDELIFLPGTQHGHRIGVVDSPLVESIQLSASMDNNDDDNNNDIIIDNINNNNKNNSSNSNSNSSSNTKNDDDGVGSSNNNSNNNTSRIQRWIENHPRLAYLWTFFFSRSSGSNNQATTYAPSAPSVFGASLDLSLPVLFNFHVFIVAFTHIQGQNKGFWVETPVKLLPICFLTVLLIRAVIPPSKRVRFWSTMKFTFTAPFHNVNVRDEFIGDCLTSWVRPGQDLLFALVYYAVVVWGALINGYSLTKCGELLEESWWLHNVILPTFAIIPLFLKYLQCLRSAYDTNQRWPYIGNALKYLSACLVIVYGTTHPDQRKSSTTWIVCFIVALVYQIFWDVVMDWQLFEIQRDISVVMADATNSESSTISSVRPDSKILLSFQIYIVQPIVDRYQRLRAIIPGWSHIQLRQKRLYKNESFYWKIFALNFLTRFTWMCCFIPAYHVSRSERGTSTVVLTSISDVNSYWGVLLPITEIFRRTLWGFLYLENETLKMMDADSKYEQVQGASYNDDGSEGDANSKFDEHRSFHKQQQVAHSAATSASGAKQQKQVVRKMFIAELYMWAAAFVILSVLVAR
ncbi:hypothetical protein FRACYDRAFT_274437 [Fragilariopsis cylindrus CCMP1102]|uniref:EXS domain-containing protein n=1 Tax=Fragilariopsis cylindrus CCMP1102 TaxID=635003 RepID=A0A1E7FT92_9STRA|nr:hypothetical protein FRACYDRAFT_274437 [Fragilariopsis cylindrus CCMP1102]|eukprot:OEU21334.1 hypothetical protein FRACYDRAFT_274437 [Fragilariopsis cylindrus CCMP1102]